MRDGDVVLFFNFRADRARQLSVALLDPGRSTASTAR
jgi:bisphosphoglycerate-independent phosphoglycerate mutase (AlkP superfamily)